MEGTEERCPNLQRPREPGLGLAVILHHSPRAPQPEDHHHHHRNVDAAADDVHELPDSGGEALFEGVIEVKRDHGSEVCGLNLEAMGSEKKVDEIEENWEELVVNGDENKENGENLVVKRDGSARTDQNLSALDAGVNDFPEIEGKCKILEDQKDERTEDNGQIVDVKDDEDEKSEASLLVQDYEKGGEESDQALAICVRNKNPEHEENEQALVVRKIQNGMESMDDGRTLTIGAGEKDNGTKDNRNNLLLEEGDEGNGEEKSHILGIYRDDKGRESEESFQDAAIKEGQTDWQAEEFIQNLSLKDERNNMSEERSSLKVREGNEFSMEIKDFDDEPVNENIGYDSVASETKDNGNEVLERSPMDKCYEVDLQNYHGHDDLDKNVADDSTGNHTYAHEPVDMKEYSNDNEINVKNKYYGKEHVNRNIGDEPVITEELRREGQKGRPLQFPLRPGAEDCAFYLRTGMCKFGSNCKFNHPLRRKNQTAKEKVKESIEFVGTPGQAECKYYQITGVCKFGQICRYNHPKPKSAVASIVEFNFLGLPIRPGERECPYYMRTSSCKYGSNCRFNHPDPTAGGYDVADGGSGPSEGSAFSRGPSESTTAFWSSSKTLNEISPFVPAMYLSTPSNHEWNGYQASAYSPETSVDTSQIYTVNSSTVENRAYANNQQMPSEVFPERPGQPECSYYIRTGDCKYKSACRYNHPKSRISKSPPCIVSDQGLPLRPDQNICAYYDRYGICKFGPACKFNHPANPKQSSLLSLSGPFPSATVPVYTGVVNDMKT